MTLGYVVIRDGLFHNEIFVKYNLCGKALNVLLKTLAPQNLTKWFTEAELRKNTSTRATEMHLITSIAVRIGFLETKVEYGKIRYKFNPKIFELTEEQFNDTLKNVKFENLSDDLLRIVEQFDFKELQKMRFNKRIDRTVADEILTDKVRQQALEIVKPRKYRKSLIDDPETVAIFGLQKAMDTGTLNQKSALDIHNEGNCSKDSKTCRICAMEQGKEFEEQVS